MPAGFQLPTSDVESVVGIQFGIFSPDEIIRRSVVEVTSPATYDGNEPKIGGLFDPRMGVLENGKNCRSCGQTNHGCPGHFGHYRLARPVYFIQFMPMIRNVLRCVCIRCGKLLIDKNVHARIAKRRGQARWKMVLDACSKINRCGQETEDGCGTVVPSRFVTEGIARIVAEWDQKDDDKEKEAGSKKTISQPLEVEYVLRLFRQITDEDVDFMGLSRYWCRPDWMICTVLPIPPPQVRPSVVQENNQRSEDDLTHKLFEIIKNNKKLQDLINKNSNRNMIHEMTVLLQYHVATLVDNKIPGVAPSAQRGGRPLKSLQQRIGSKEGRVRYNIQGKRVEQSARSVITGDPNISIAEVGVPMKIAMNLTRPEVVTNYNRDRLYKYVQNGADVFPGAKSIVRGKDSRMISLKHVNTKEIKLYNGDTVNRHLMDGDIILFNRQPTLHRMSMMGHRVRVLPYNTFRLNVTVTRPYNADFDGDEMNAHIPQSYEATAELQEIASVPMQIIRPRDSTPVIGVVQDALAGSYLATRPGNFFTRREFMNMMMKNKNFSEVPAGRAQDPASGKARYTGQQLIETLLNPINLTMPNKMYENTNSDSDLVKIHEGKFLQGTLDKGIFNSSGKGIVHVTYNDYGPKEAVDFMDGLQSMMETYLIMKGFSVGISDLIADETTRKEMEETIAQSKREIDDLILQVHTGLFTNNSGKSNQEEFEVKAMGILDKARDGAGKKGVQNLSEENRLMAMIRSGSKGDENNVAQMIACLGQQAVEGRRIPYGFTDRTLPHYKMFDDGAEARGFVESSFVRGLTPQEFFFHAMTGREGLIDTAVKTADTGYTQRQLIKAMEDLMTQHDGTVRDGSGKIVQFRYGEDGLNSTKLEQTSLPVKFYNEATKKVQTKGLNDMNYKDVMRIFSMEGIDFAPILQPGAERGDDKEVIDEYVDQVLKDRKMLVEDMFGSGRVGKVFTSLNLDRLLLNIGIKFNLNTSGQTTLTPATVIDGINRIAERTQPYNKLWVATLRTHLAPHDIIVNRRFTKEAWDALVEMIVVKNWKSWAIPGELVGIVAAQSIGEPATQMTLNTFHQAGVASKSAVTRGVPRLKELLKVTKNPKATSLTVYLKKPYCTNNALVREVAQDLELTLLRDIILKSAIYYDPEDESTIIPEDRDVITFFKETELRGSNGSCAPQEDAPEPTTPYSKWIIRFEFDREKMFSKNITMDDVYFVIQNAYGFYGSKDDNLQTIYTDYNSSKLVMRIRPRQGDGAYGDDLAAIKKFQSNLINNTIIRGVYGIKAVNWRKDKEHVELVDGAYTATEQYVLDTDGSNFVTVMNHPAVDGNKLYSTNVHDIYDQLGIEATRTGLYSEISGLFGEAEINYRHLGLLCDVMTHAGRLMSIDRYGINKMDNGPISKACFEETEKVLLLAALFGEMDPVTGVSANIMMGQPIRAGTAFTQILLDEQALPRLMEGLAPMEAAEEEEDGFTQDQLDARLYGTSDDKCDQVQNQMNMSLGRGGPMIEDEDEIEIVEVK
jgi:DNA-directed RNA polymerase II subunit RPB1